MTSPEDLRGVGWDRLLPGHRAHGTDRPLGPVTCLGLTRLADGLSLALLADDLGRVWPAPLRDDPGGPRRAVAGDGASEALVALLPGGTRVVDDVTLTVWHHEPATGERAITVDQTNESVVVGNRVVVKWMVPADEGPHPAPSLLALLDEAGFRGTPRPWAIVEWDGRLVASLVDCVPGAQDGWTWAVEDIRRAAETGDRSAVAAAGEAVGVLVASFHGALRSTRRRPTPEEVGRWRAASVAQLEQALTATSGPPHELLSRHAPSLRRLFEAMPDVVQVMRVHGDLHIGQVLRSEADDPPGPQYLLADFDGNPLDPPSERAGAQPAAVDVAGMAQSFLHAGLVVARHHPELPGAAVAQAAYAARDAFLDAYRREAEDGDAADDRLIEPLAARQVCREFVYAASHLPRWSYVPEAAVAILAEDVDES